MTGEIDSLGLKPKRRHDQSRVDRNPARRISLPCSNDSAWSNAIFRRLPLLIMDAGGARASKLEQQIWNEFQMTRRNP